MPGPADQSLNASVACNRVPVLNSHTVCISLRLAEQPPRTVSEVRNAMKEYALELQLLGCPSGPRQPTIVSDKANRPQPRLDLENEKGYGCSVGRNREDENGFFDIHFVTLSHNTTLGAAVSSIAILKGCI